MNPPKELQPMIEMIKRVWETDGSGWTWEPDTGRWEPYPQESEAPAKKTSRGPSTKTSSQSELPFS